MISAASLQRAFEANATTAKAAEDFGAKRQAGEDDLASPGVRAVAAELEMSREEANELVEVCLRASVDDPDPDLQKIRYDSEIAALAIGQVYGYLAAMREEATI